MVTDLLFIDRTLCYTNLYFFFDQFIATPSFPDSDSLTLLQMLRNVY
jgi:hypothetical protein